MEIVMLIILAVPFAGTVGFLLHGLITDSKGFFEALNYLPQMRGRYDSNGNLKEPPSLPF